MKALVFTTERPCTHCGETKSLSEFRLKKNGHYESRCRLCKNACINEYNNTPEGKAKMQARSKAWYEANKEQSNVRGIAWRAAHPERAREISKKCYEKHTEERHIYNAAHYAANKELVKQKVRAWIEANREKVRDMVQRREALRKGNYCEKVDRKAVIERDKSICHICGKKVKPKDMSLDHLIPLSKGGPHKAINLRVAHRSCNSRRGNGRIPAQLLLLA